MATLNKNVERPGTLRASIVIPLKVQRDEWLEACVRSALNQTVQSEVLVITSPHTPESNRSVLRRLGSGRGTLRAIERDAGTGFADAINKGMRLASVARAGLLLSDDWLEPDAVQRCLAVDADIVSTGMKVFAADGDRKLWERSLSAGRLASLASLEEKARYLRHFFVFRRDKVLAVGGVDNSIGLTGADDYDLIWTMLEHGASAAVVEQPLYNYRDHDEERLTLRAAEDQLSDLKRIFNKHEVSPDEQARLIEIQAPWFGQPMHIALQKLSARLDEV